ncbi:MAG: site-specific integrase [Acidobacteria bacterium]|nr:site-specific integrase [Acidobacteriota bacterium]
MVYWLLRFDLLNIHTGKGGILQFNLQKELEFWREKCRYPDGDQIVFPSRRGGPLESHNYLQRVLKSKGKEVGIGIEDITFQALRCTFATQVHGIGTVKDAQTQLRHSNATTTMNVYTQEIPSSVKATVEALDQNLLGVLNTIEHEFKM